MSFDVVVLGASGTFPTKDGAATGLLFRGDSAHVWVDAGTGTFANLQRYVDYFDLDAVVLSHLHLDHILDIYPLYYGLRYSVRSTSTPTRMDVYAPAGTEAFLARMLYKGDGDEPQDFCDYLSFQTIGSGQERTIAGFSFRFAATRHPTETLAMRVERDGRSLTYTSDTAPDDTLIALAKGSNVLIAEASLQVPNESLTDVHMTAEQAGKLAADAQVDRLVLSHVSPGL
ncbi:MAG: MBL fold metallo-hydrolase, partial [Actinobacteria bacterium]|nr:MBL fold metallo-hydrolase [Actinomycetota bacterium]